MVRPRRASTGLALVAALGWVAAGCGASAWPSVEGLADPAFVAGARPVTTIDVLPVDVQLWSHDGRDPEAMAVGLDEVVGAVLADELGRRGYDVGARIGWDGQFIGPDGAPHPAMSAEAIAATAYALSSFGAAQARVHDRLLVPFLPHRLGEATDGQATLYVGGWAFAGKAPASRTKQVLKYALITLAVAAIVVIAVACAKGSCPSLGGVASGAGKVATGAVRVAGRLAGGVGRLALSSARFTLRGAHAIARSGRAFELVLDTADGALRMADSFGHLDTHIAVVAERPDYFQAPGAPRRGRSRFLLELTLIENASGTVLWHARRELGADPSKPRDVARALDRMLATLPAAR